MYILARLGLAVATRGATSSRSSSPILPGRVSRGSVNSTRMWVQPSASAAWIGTGWVIAASQ